MLSMSFGFANAFALVCLEVFGYLGQMKLRSLQILCLVLLCFQQNIFQLQFAFLLVMPYGFASGYWPMDGPDLGRILDYTHQHGGICLGMRRFNVSPTKTVTYRRVGFPGFYTQGEHE